MLKQKFFVDFASKLIIYFLTALTGILVTRMAGPDVIGTITYGYSYVSLFFFMFGLFGTSHIKLISEGKNLGDCNKIYSIIIFTTFILFIVIVLSFYFIQKNYFGKSFSNIEEIVIFLTIAMVGIQGLYKIPDITFTAQLQQFKINLPNLIRTLIFNVGRVIVVLLGFKAIALVSVNLISAIIIIPFYLYLMGPGFFSGKWDIQLFKKYLKVGLPILIITITISITSNYSKVLFKDFSSITELGYFSGAIGLASMLIMVGDTAGSLFFPLFSKAFSEGNYVLITEQIKKYEHFLFLFLLPVIISFSVNSNTIILFLLGDSYLSSVPIFSILIFFSFFKIWSIPYYNLMNGLNKFNLNAFTHIFFLVIFFISLYFLIHKEYLYLGGLGLAIAFLIENIVKLVVWHFFVNKTVRINIKKDLLVFTSFYIIIYLIGIFIYEKYFIEQNYLLKFGFFCFYTVLIYFSLFVLKLLKREDIQYAVSVMNLKSLFEYFQKEIKKKK